MDDLQTRSRMRRFLGASASQQLDQAIIDADSQLDKIVESERERCGPGRTALMSTF
jgi:hypothetical protein